MRSPSVGLIAVLVLLLAAGGGMAQSADPAQPEWSDDLFDRLENTAAEYNAREESDPGFLERELLRNARINLYVSDDTGAQAVYSLRVDDELRVTELHRGPLDDPTIRAETTKTTVERIAAADDPQPAIRRAVRNRQIRVERVISLFGGLRFRIGVEDVLVGAGTIAIVSLVSVKFGFSTISSVVTDVAYDLLGVFQRVWNYLSGISLGAVATSLTILQQLDLLEPLKEQVGKLWGIFKSTVASVLSSLDGSSTETDRDEEQ